MKYIPGSKVFIKDPKTPLQILPNFKRNMEYFIRDIKPCLNEKREINYVNYTFVEKVNNPNLPINLISETFESCEYADKLFDKIMGITV